MCYSFLLDTVDGTEDRADTHSRLRSTGIQLAASDLLTRQQELASSRLSVCLKHGVRASCYFGRSAFAGNIGRLCVRIQHCLAPGRPRCCVRHSFLDDGLVRLQCCRYSRGCIPRAEHTRRATLGPCCIFSVGGARLVCVATAANRAAPPCLVRVGPYDDDGTRSVEQRDGGGDDAR